MKVALEAIQDGTSAKGQYGHGTVLKRASEAEDDISTRSVASVARKKLAKAMSTLDRCCFANLFALFSLRFQSKMTRLVTIPESEGLFFVDHGH